MPKVSWVVTSNPFITMRLTKLFTFLFLMVIALTFTSCSEDDDSNSEDVSTFIRFTIDGTDYDFGNIISAESLSLTLNGNNGEGLTDPGDTQISIFLPVEPVEGTFDFQGTFDGDHKLSFSSESLGFDFDFAEDGSITITEISDDFIEGTFTATITSEDDTTINITSGTFKGEMF